jgi:hypothetical protein
MPAVKKKAPRWEVYRIKGSSPAFLGSVYAADIKSAEKVAIKQFEIKDPHHVKRVYVRLA